MTLRIFTLIVLASLLASCGAPGASLWGNYATPTPEFSAPPSPTADPPTIAPTLAIIDPTATLIPPLVTDTPIPAPSSTEATPTLAPLNTAGPMIVYYSQGGDTLQIVASRFGVAADQIISTENLPVTGLLNPNTLLLVPDSALQNTTFNQLLIPDSDVVFSPSAIDLNVADTVNNAGGYLSTYKEYLISSGWTTGAEAVDRIALENSINPRLLLALIEYESQWVRGQPQNFAASDYPLGFKDFYYRGLFRQMMWAVQKISLGYYGWRSGTLTELTFPDGTKKRIAPNLNAGTVALQYFFAQTRNPAEWERAIDPKTGFPALYAEMFGDAWTRAAQVEPLIPAGLKQPALSLPFTPGQVWAFSGGPHAAWEHEGPLAALDFAPAADFSGCVKSDNWVLAPTPGLVARSEDGVVVLDLDGDGNEQTGWVILFLHIGAEGRVAAGNWLSKDDRIGHPSCEGGIATGTHVHIARKYNGEWMLADGPIPFEMSGWVAHNGDAPYKGTLTRGDETVTACTCGSFETRIERDKSDQ
jgi:hypothetical protein